MITVTTKQKRYNVVLNNSFDTISECMLKLFTKEISVFIITDETVMPIYGEAVQKALSGAFKRIYTIVLQQGEANKNHDTVALAYKFLLENSADRSSVVLALGGGVVGDISGFVAATYMRGISFVQVPTTLLAQVDSSVGGKTGVDFLGYKNIIGAFYQPELVYINIETLASLPHRQLAAGMAEVIKYGLIMDKRFFHYVVSNAGSAFHTDMLSGFVEKSIEYKAKIVELDENDKGIREILNFGHTFGHAIEAICGFKLLHGECVALGMACALRISEKRHGFTVLDEYLSVLDKMGLHKTVRGITNEQIFNAMQKDKKNKQGKISFVLLKETGNAYSARDVTNDEIIYGLKFVTENIQ